MKLSAGAPQSGGSRQRVVHCYALEVPVDLSTATRHGFRPIVLPPTSTVARRMIEAIALPLSRGRPLDLRSPALTRNLA